MKLYEKYLTNFVIALATGLIGLGALTWWLVKELKEESRDDFWWVLLVIWTVTLTICIFSISKIGYKEIKNHFVKEEIEYVVVKEKKGIPILNYKNKKLNT